MLPPGHIAGGLLAAEALLKILKPDLPQSQLNQLLWWGMFFSFAPDLDSFISFAKERSLAVRNADKNDHRNFFSHAPILWLLAGLAVYAASGSVYLKTVGLLLWVCSWSHFLLDSIDHGVMWLWPLSKKRYALNRPDALTNTEPTFFGYWAYFLKAYASWPTFYAELAVVTASILVAIKLFSHSIF